MKRKLYYLEKLVYDQKVANSFKVTIGGAYALMVVLADVEINQLYEKFKNEANRKALEKKLKTCANKE